MTEPEQGQATDEVSASPVPPPVNVNVGTPFKGKASNPNERKSIAEDPTGESNAGGGGGE